MGAKNERLTISVTEAAELLGVSRRFAYEMVAQGQIPSVRLGNKILISRRALEASINPDEYPEPTSP